MKATQWPNGLGYNVRTPYGVAEVRDIVYCLRVFAPCAPRREVVTCLRTGERRVIHTAVHRVLDVPLGTDPAEAVTRCQKTGVRRADA